MRHSATVSCDFCKQPIDRATRWTTIDATIPVRVHVSRDIWRQDPDEPSRPFAPQVGIPSHRTLDMCRDCEAKYLPDLRALVAVLTTVELEEARAKAQQPNAPAKFGGTGET